MDPARWQQLSPLLDELFELDPAARATRLHALRAEDPALADELEALIALDEAEADFLSQPITAHHQSVLPGSQVGPYRLEHLLGEGGMGQVWLASRADGLYQRRVGLKLLRPGLADTNLRLRFTRERQILARLAHPHIARLLDAGISADGLPYLALEYVDGAPITDYCRDRNTSLADRLRMFEQICAAVSHAHANLIIHRDLKPSNILVTPAGDVRLLDFGIAKLLDSDIAPERTRTGMRAFTLHYAAPEQIRGEPVTTMTDVYSLGVVLYELLADTKPYRLKRDSDAAWEEAILQHDPAKPSQTLLQTGTATHSRHDIAVLRRRARTLAGDLDNIVLKTLSKRPEQRYPSVEALTQDLLRYASGRPVHARAQSWGYRLRKFLGRYRWPLATATLTTLVLSAALVIVAWQARQAVSEAARAQAMQAFMIGVFEGAGGTRDGEPMSLRELLTTSVERGRRELARQPRALAEVLGVVARLRTGLGDYAVAHALLDEQAELIQASDDTPASLRLESFTQRGRIARLLGDPVGCIALMQPALERARHEQAQLPPQVTEFYSQLGRCRRAHGERQTARQLFERSLALRREGGGNPVAVVENLIDLAGLRADANDTSTALQQFSAARDQLQRDAGDRHPLLIEIHSNLSQLHRAQGQLDRAAHEIGTALAVARDVLGPQHATTLAVQRQFTALQIEQGLYTEAVTDLRESHRLLSDRLGPDDVALAGGYRALGLVEWERGDTRAALSALRHALRIHRDGAQPAATANALIDLASVLHASGQDASAYPLLLEARAVGKTIDGYARANEANRLLGEIEIAQGRHEDGVLRLQGALEQLRRNRGDNDPQTRRAELALAYYRANHLAGQPLALAGMSKLDLLGGLPESIELRDTIWRARAYAAQLRCHGPRRLEAVQQLQLLDATLQQARPEGGAVRRELDAIRAGCNVPGVGIQPLARD
ncbi:MAG: protein kinase domain-containing protein [Lysobacter sp.]